MLQNMARLPGHLNAGAIELTPRQRNAVISIPLRPATGLFQRFAGFEETLETCEDLRPSTRNGFDELRVRFVDLVDDGELDRLALLFEFIGQS